MHRKNYVASLGICTLTTIFSFAFSCVFHGNDPTNIHCVCAICFQCSDYKQLASIAEGKTFTPNVPAYLQQCRILTPLSLGPPFHSIAVHATTGEFPRRLHVGNRLPTIGGVRVRIVQLDRGVQQQLHREFARRPPDPQHGHKVPIFNAKCQSRG